MRLANLLGGGEPPAAEDERLAWLESIGPEIHDAGEAETPRGNGELERDHRKRVNAARRRITHARWRAYLRGPRELRGIGERMARDERLRAAAERLNGRGIGTDGLTESERQKLQEARQ
jgi:hypothetical protein